LEVTGGARTVIDQLRDRWTASRSPGALTCASNGANAYVPEAPGGGAST